MPSTRIRFGSLENIVEKIKIKRIKSKIANVLEHERTGQNTIDEMIIITLGYLNRILRLPFSA